MLFFSSIVLAQQSPTTSGACSPIAPGNSGTITINCQGIPRKLGTKIVTLLNKNQDSAKDALAKMDRCVHSIEDIGAKFEELREQINRLGDTASPKNPLAKYPLGYVIFEVGYTEGVFPYQSGGLEDYKIDWSSVQLLENTDDHMAIKFPNFSSKERNIEVWDNFAVTDKKVGSRFSGIAVNGVLFSGEILALRNDGVVFVIGLKQWHRTSSAPGVKSN